MSFLFNRIFQQTFMMEDESASLDGKGLINMRVVDLKQELDKRGLSKSGSKKDLVKRLKQQLEFEKLCEERKTGDFHVELELDAETQQNEFVQQYLAQQQKRYAEREEEKRLQLEAMQKCPEENSTVSCEHQSEVDEHASSDTDDKDGEKQNLIKPSENESQSENTNDEYVSVKSVASDKKDSHIPICDSKLERFEKNPPSPLSVASVCDIDVKNTCDNTQQNRTNESQTIIQNLSNVTEIEGRNLSISKCVSKTETKNLLVTEHEKDCLSVVINTDDSKEPKSVKANTSNHSFDEEDSKVAIGTSSELTEHGKCQSKSSFTSKEVRNITSYCVSPERNSSENLSKQKSSENMEVSDCSPVPYSLSDIQLPESPDSHKKSKNIKREEKDKMDHSSDEEINENFYKSRKNKSNGETQQKINSSQEDASESETKDSTYSNDSPEKIKMIKDKRCSDDSSDESDRNSSPYKKKSFKNENISSNLAADSDSDHPKRTVSKEQKSVKALQNTDESDIEKSSDFEKYNRRVDSKHKLHKKHRKRDSRSPSSSSSSSSRSRSKTRSKSRSKSRSRSKSKSRSRSRSKSKSKSRSRSSDSSTERRHSKKSTATRSKNFAQDDDSNQMSDKSSDEKSVKHKKYKNFARDSEINKTCSESLDEKSAKHKENKNFTRDDDNNQMNDKSLEEKSVKHKKNKNFARDDDSNKMSDKSSDEKSVKPKKNDSATESPADTSVTVKRRFKIKRDNIPIEIPKKKSPVKESLEANSSNKSTTEKKASSHSTPDKTAKQESVEEKEEKPEINYKPRKILLSNRKLNRKSSEDNNNTEPMSKKTKWESFASGQKSSHAYSISTDSLRNWFPDFKLVRETSMEVEQDEHSLSAVDEKNGDTIPRNTLNENESSMKQESTSQLDIEDTVSQEPNFDDTADVGPVSKIIFIQNLVRPFTLNQLKDLLKQSGKIVEEYFWIDKIKSKCFVMYESEKEAIKARCALNNTRWPISNPKILSVEFSSIEELEKHQKGNEPPPPLKPPESPAVEPSDTLETRVSHTTEEHKRKDRERRKEKERTKQQVPVREWDKDKIIQDSPERERPPKEEKPRSAEKKEKKESKKRATEDTPAKLLDDLFQKTKSVPCIYWLPLTEEQAKTKEEERKMRRLEREKRNQQLREQEEAERRNRRARSSSRRREKENRKSSTRSRSPVSRRR